MTPAPRQILWAWGSFVFSIVVAILLLVGGLLVLLPLQVLPAPTVVGKHKYHYAATGAIWVLISWGYLFTESGLMARSVLTLLVALIAVAMVYAGREARSLFGGR